MTTALVRKPSPSFINAISKHPRKNFIDAEKAQTQHQLYVDALNQIGVKVIFIHIIEKQPDGVFIEDTALIFENEAFLCSMGAKSRREERISVLPELEKLLTVEIIQPPIIVDGGDVIQTEDTLFIGISGRTNQTAVDFFRSRQKKKVVPVPISGCLHLKTATTFIGRNTMIVDPEKVDSSFFSGFNIIRTSPPEAYSSNVLAIGDSIIMAKGYPNLAKTLTQQGFEVLPTPMSEFKKADGGVTCLSLIIS